MLLFILTFKASLPTTPMQTLRCWHGEARVERGSVQWDKTHESRQISKRVSPQASGRFATEAARLLPLTGDELWEGWANGVATFENGRRQNDYEAKHSEIYTQYLYESELVELKITFLTFILSHWDNWRKHVQMFKTIWTRSNVSWKSNPMNYLIWNKSNKRQQSIATTHAQKSPQSPPSSTFKKSPRID